MKNFTNEKNDECPFKSTNSEENYITILNRRNRKLRAPKITVVVKKKKKSKKNLLSLRCQNKIKKLE